MSRTRTTSTFTASTGRIPSSSRYIKNTLGPHPCSEAVDRVKLIMSILKCDPNENGAGLVLEEVVESRNHPGGLSPA